MKEMSFCFDPPGCDNRCHRSPPTRLETRTGGKNHRCRFSSDTLWLSTHFVCDSFLVIEVSVVRAEDVNPNAATSAKSPTHRRVLPQTVFLSWVLMDSHQVVASSVRHTCELRGSVPRGVPGRKQFRVLRPNWCLAAVPVTTFLCLNLKDPSPSLSRTRSRIF